MSEEYTGPMEDPQEEIGANLSVREKALRDSFVREYLIDYNAHAAAIRIGYGPAYARDYAIRLMEEPYVLHQIKQVECAPSEDSEEEMKKRVMAGLVREANYRGPGASAAARVSALAKLAAIHGMDAPIRSKTEISGLEGQALVGVIVVPGLMTPEEWEIAAAKQQEALVAQPAPGTPDPVTTQTPTIS